MGNNWGERIENQIKNWEI